jgi:predicted dehydrogenase
MCAIGNSGGAAEGAMPLGVAVVGTGYWGMNLVRNFAKSPECVLVAACDQHPEPLKSVAMGYPAVRTTTDFTSVLDDPRVEAIAVATPVQSHFSLAMAALNAGKHVFVEKPLADGVARSRQLVDEANARRLVLMVDHTFIYTGAVRKIRELIDRGELGELQYYDATRINLGLFQHDVNVLWDLAVHDLSILAYLIESQPHTVATIGARHVGGMPENLAYLTILYERGMIAHINVNWLSPVKVRRTLVAGSRRMIVYDDLEPSEKVKVYDRGVTVTDDPVKIRDMLIGYRTGDMWAPQLDTAEALQVAVGHFADCVRTGVRPQTHGQAAVTVVEILEAATESMRCNGRPVEVKTVAAGC